MEHGRPSDLPAQMGGGSEASHEINEGNSHAKGHAARAARQEKEGDEMGSLGSSHD
jgi:hypothetical protein